MTDRAGDYTPWLVYFLGGFSYQMITTKQRARRGEDGELPALVRDRDPRGPTLR